MSFLYAIRENDHNFYFALSTSELNIKSQSNTKHHLFRLKCIETTKYEKNSRLH